MSVTSDEVNFLIYRYLQESGFSHSAFTFAYESLVTKSAVTAGDLPPGALISLLQKGLQYVEIEAHLNEDGSKRDCPDPFALLMPYAVRKRARIERDAPDTDSSTRESSSSSSGKTSSGRKASPADNIVRPDEVSNLRGHTNEVFVCRWNPKHDLLASGSKDSTARIWSIPHGASGMASGEAASLHPWVLDHSGNGDIAGQAKAAGDGAAAASSDSGPDSKADGSSATASRDGAGSASVGKDVTTMDWDPTGELLATGTFDGTARVWDRAGSLKSVLVGHKGPIFSLQWNKSGTALLSGSMDKSAIVWDPTTGAVKQQFNFHSEPTLDVDWRDDGTFATCSSDKFIHICEVGAQKPVKTFEGHMEEVNAIQWSPSGNLLASCSDDKTAKIWSVDQNSNDGRLVHDFTDHEREVRQPDGWGFCVFVVVSLRLLPPTHTRSLISFFVSPPTHAHTQITNHKSQQVYTVKWSPTGAGSANPNANLVLASGSWDSNIRLWDPTAGKCLFSLVKHTAAVYSVAFSPDGKYIASGAFDKRLHIWSVKDGALVKTLEGPAGIFDVCWNRTSTRISAGFSDGLVATIDLRK